MASAIESIGADLIEFVLLDLEPGNLCELGMATVFLLRAGQPVFTLLGVIGFLSAGMAYLLRRKHWL